jgi:hypothetical protein
MTTALRATGTLMRWLARRLSHQRRLDACAAEERRRLQRETWRRVESGEGLPPKVRAWLDTL